MFWDTSAIVLLCCSQPATAQARRLARECRQTVVWWATSVEARSAFARLVRKGEMASSDLPVAIALLENLRRSWREVQPSQDMRLLAERIPDEYGVKAGDAFQLAAALVWCRERPRRRPFVCFDDRLAKAAAKAGFTVRPALPTETSSASAPPAAPLNPDEEPVKNSSWDPPSGGLVRLKPDPTSGEVSSQL